ncbi:hypothetical protein NC652_013358 [Populus alba x Populus x berolinensis]|nr:hypothetical protein NC652_013358 [Populus alba x Populus x berolinensis]
MSVEYWESFAPTSREIYEAQLIIIPLPPRSSMKNTNRPAAMPRHPFDQSRNASVHRKTQPLGTHLVSPSMSGPPRVLRTFSSQKRQSMIALPDIATGILLQTSPHQEPRVKSTYQ